MPSYVWGYFKKIDATQARCQVERCSKVLTFSKGTNSLGHHLRTVHNIDKPKQTAPEEPSDTQSPTQHQKKQKTIVGYFRTTTMEEDIARMTCQSTLSFNQVAETNFIRQQLALKYPGQIIPQDTKGISKKMMEYFTFAEGEVIERIKKLKADGKKFSATLDEWTSNANCRYMNMNLHYTFSQEGETAYINLGLCKIEGRFPATRTLEMVSVKCSNIWSNILIVIL